MEQSICARSVLDLAVRGKGALSTMPLISSSTMSTVKMPRDPIPTLNRTPTQNNGVEEDVGCFNFHTQGNREGHIRAKQTSLHHKQSPSHCSGHTSLCLKRIRGNEGKQNEKGRLERQISWQQAKQAKRCSNLHQSDFHRSGLSADGIRRCRQSDVTTYTSLLFTCLGSQQTES